MDVTDAAAASAAVRLAIDEFGALDVVAALPVLHKQRSGHFIQFSSIGGRVRHAGHGRLPDG